MSTSGKPPAPGQSARPSAGPPASRPPPSPPPSRPTCALSFDDRVVLRASVPPEAEFALFDVGDLELRTGEPGRVRERGYRTTVGVARQRLAQLGIERRAVDSIVNALVPDLAHAYARGSAVQRVIAHLGPRELLASAAYDGEPPVYRGTFLDLAQLAGDTWVPGAGVTLRLLGLSIALDAERSDAVVELSTDLYTKGRRSGERTYKRPVFPAVADVESALLQLAAQRPKPVRTVPLPRADVLAFVRERAHASDDDDEIALYARLEREVGLRDRPERGPLAEPDLWDIEQRVETERLDGLVPALEAVERKYGKTPATIYLRGRVALALRLEHPRSIAERVSALALAMTSFQELALLAAEAWIEAAEPKRALPFARDVVEAPGVDEGLVLVAQRLTARAAAGAPQTASRPPPRFGTNAPPANTRERPSVSPSLAPSASSFTLEVPARLTPPPTPASASRPPDAIKAREPSLLPPAADDTETPRVPAVAPRIANLTPPAQPAAAPAARRPASSQLTAQRSSLAPPSKGPPSARTHAVARVETVAPSAADPRAEPSDVSALGAMPAHRAPRIDVHDPSLVGRPSERPRSLSPAPKPPSASEPFRSRLVTVASARAGAARPAWQVESAPPPFMRTHVGPVGTSGPEITAETLPFPVGVDPTSTAAIPRNALEARVTFTRLTRTLGREYRTRRGTALTTGVRGVEMVQAVLLEVFSDHEVRNDEHAELIAAHGAFFSEVLARTLGAEWVDVDGDDVMRWSMIVPPDARVWPFARIARLVAMGHRERDLVATYLEVSARAAQRPR